MVPKLEFFIQVKKIMHSIFKNHLNSDVIVASSIFELQDLSKYAVVLIFGGNSIYS
jgi:hypothetical protein